MTVQKKPSVIDIIEAFAQLFLYIAVIVLFMVVIMKWANGRAAENKAKSKARYEELIKRPSETRTTNYSPSSTSDYVESRGTDDCTSDCSGHDAGYEYAEENDICDTEYSDGNADSFNEGVVAWSEDNC